MKRTKYKLIVKLKNYTIYTNNDIEYCRFKNKYYPIEQFEAIIDSYKNKIIIRDIIKKLRIVCKLIKDFKHFITSLEYTDKTVVLMSSGSYGGLNLDTIKELVSNSS